MQAARVFFHLNLHYRLWLNGNIGLVLPGTCLGEQNRRDRQLTFLLVYTPTLHSCLRVPPPYIPAYVYPHLTFLLMCTPTLHPWSVCTPTLHPWSVCTPTLHPCFYVPPPYIPACVYPLPTPNPYTTPPSRHANQMMF